LLNVLKSNYNVNAYVAIISMRVGKRRTHNIEIWILKLHYSGIKSTGKRRRQSAEIKTKDVCGVPWVSTLLAWHGDTSKTRDKPAWLRFEIMQCLGFDAAKLLYAILFPFHA
ncbi:hypothetical protein T4B_14073, partial [Trichinella pseudospiralis]